MDVTALMEKAIGQQAADLHLQTGRPPMLRLAQGLCSFPGPPLSEDDVRCLLHAVGWTRDEVGDGAFFWRRSLRCRLHVCREYAGLHATIRFLYPLASLPPDGDGPLLERLSRLTQGLVLVCGPTGSGKTTALWRILQAINERRPCHIITLEDPIEYVEKGKAALITQRELGTHFPDFAEGIRQALRQDPDVILIGEMRDRPAMDAALMAAETGHFVLSTLHTPSAAQAVSRIAGAYSGDARQEVRYRLAMVLQAVLAQRRLEEQGQVEIVREVLVRTPAVVQLIRSGKEYQLPTVMQTGAAAGMRTMDQALRRCRAAIAVRSIWRPCRWSRASVRPRPWTSAGPSPSWPAASSGPASRQGTSKDSAVSWPISMKPRGRSGASSSRPWPIRRSCWSA